MLYRMLHLPCMQARSSPPAGCCAAPSWRMSPPHPAPCPGCGGRPPWEMGRAHGRRAWSTRQLGRSAQTRGWGAPRPLSPPPRVLHWRLWAPARPDQVNSAACTQCTRESYEGRVAGHRAGADQAQVVLALQPQRICVQSACVAYDMNSARCQQVLAHQWRLAHGQQ